MKKNNLETKRKEIFKISIQYIQDNGWNKNLFKLVSNNSEYNYDEIVALFPNYHIDLLKFYFNQLNEEMSSSFDNLENIPSKTHKKIREIILLRLNIYAKQKKLIKKTYFTIILPRYSKISSLLLFKTVDQMWFIAGDKSTDFNYYSKRLILATIYSSTVLYFLRSNFNYPKTVIFLDKQLIKVSKIPNLKKKINNFSKTFFKTFGSVFNLSSIKQ